MNFKTICSKCAASLLLAASLTWQDNSDNENGFVVEAAYDCASFQAIAYVGVNVTSFSDPAAVDQECYRVAAYNDDGMSPYSNVAQYLAPAPVHKCKGKKC